MNTALNIDELEKKQKWFLLPICLLVGLALLLAFVSFSQNYLSEYLVRNSKDHVGEKIDPALLAQHLNEPLIVTKPIPRVLVFWSVTCAPCLEKLSKIKDLNLNGSTITPINTDAAESHELAKKLLAISLPQQTFYHDENKVLETQLGIDYLPTNIHLAADGTIEKIEIGQK